VGRDRKREIHTKEERDRKREEVHRDKRMK